ncbi:MAG: glycosyltransferase family 1 protein [Ferruginibacter sp.]
MTIAINSTRFLKPTGNDFYYDYFIKIAASKPEHQFVFITPSRTGAKLITFQNTIHVISSPMANTPLMWKIWLDHTLPGIARRHKADIIFNTGGVCSLRTRLPQWLFISDLSILFIPAFFLRRQQHFLKKNMPAFLTRATTIVTASDFLSKEITRRYSIEDGKINTIQLIASDHYQPAGWIEKESIKEQYAAGKEYFLFSGEIHPQNNLVNLLKAFSFFKKRQKSNMQLIITAGSVSANDPFIENLKTFKYRKEVNLLVNLPEEDLAKITAGAYAFLYPAMYEGTTLIALQAMQCEVPVISGNTGAIKEIAGDAVLLADPANFEDIADKMMQVFKDEANRTELVRRGILISQKYNKDSMDDQWWKSIMPLSSSVHNRFK